MTDAHQTEDPALLAQAIAERIAPLCSRVPRSDLEHLTSRLAWLQLAGDERPEQVDPSVPAEPSNRIVWLPGPQGAAIVLPAGEETGRRFPTLAGLQAHARRHVQAMRTIQARSITTLRHARSTLLHAYHARAGAEAPDR